MTTKVAAIERLGAEVRFAGDDVGRTEGIARDYAAQHRLAYIPPYNDWDVVIGQGTMESQKVRDAVGAQRGL